MLVMSRRKDQKIVFPSLGITVKLLNLQGNSASLGIDAPPEVAIVRDEVMSRSGDRLAGRPDPHSVRNVLNSIHLFVMVYQKQIEAELAEAAANTFVKLLEYLEKQTQMSGGVDVSVDHETTGGIDGHVMVVEDDPDQRDMLCNLLTMQGLGVTGYSNGQGALKELRSGAPADIILLDWSIPNFGGEWLVPKIRREFGAARPKIFVLNGAETVTQPLRSSVDAWIAKPLNQNTLIARIQSVYRTACSSDSPAEYLL